MYGLAADAAGVPGRDGIPGEWNARRHNGAAPVAAVGHATATALRQAGVADRSNGIPAVRDPAGRPGVTGRTVTMDATRARHGTARRLPGRRADHPVTAARENQETIHDDLRATGLTRTGPSTGATDAPGAAAAPPSTSPARNGTADPPSTGAARPSAPGAGAGSPRPAGAAPG